MCGHRVDQALVDVVTVGHPGVAAYRTLDQHPGRCRRGRPPGGPRPRRRHRARRRRHASRSARRSRSCRRHRGRPARAGRSTAGNRAPRRRGRGRGPRAGGGRRAVAEPGEPSPATAALSAEMPLMPSMKLKALTYAQPDRADEQDQSDPIEGRGLGRVATPQTRRRRNLARRAEHGCRQADREVVDKPEHGGSPGATSRTAAVRRSSADDDDAGEPGDHRKSATARDRARDGTNARWARPGPAPRRRSRDSGPVAPVPPPGRRGTGHHGQATSAGRPAVAPGARRTPSTSRRSVLWEW